MNRRTELNAHELSLTASIFGVAVATFVALLILLDPVHPVLWSIGFVVLMSAGTFSYAYFETKRRRSQED